MAGATGLEPATYGVTGRHSNQLSYAPAIFREGVRCRGGHLYLFKQAYWGVAPSSGARLTAAIQGWGATTTATAPPRRPRRPPLLLGLARRLSWRLGAGVEFLGRDLAVAILVHLVEQRIGRAENSL